MLQPLALLQREAETKTPRIYGKPSKCVRNDHRFEGWGTDENAIIKILGGRTAAQRAAISEAYARLYNEMLLDCLHSELSGDFRDIKKKDTSPFSSMMKVTVWCSGSPERHFAEVLRSSIIGLGIDEASVTRAIISRAELDIEKIKTSIRGYTKPP